MEMKNAKIVIIITLPVWLSVWVRRWVNSRWGANFLRWLHIKVTDLS